MLNAEVYQESPYVLNGVALTITTYKIGERFYCHIQNADPGATIARASGTSREEATEAALAKVSKRLG